MRAARLGPAAAGVALTAAVLSLGAAGCLKEKDSLVIVGLTSAVDLSGPTAVQITVADVTQTFDVPTGLSATIPVRRGVYVGSKDTGVVRVSATTRFGSPCSIYASSDTVVVPAAGASVEIALTLAKTAKCDGGDAGGGTGGAGGGAGTTLPSLANCREFTHSAANDCTDVNDAIIYSVAISPSGTLVASVGDDGRAKIWRFDGTTLTPEGHVLQGSGFGVAVFSPDGTILAVGWSTGIDLYSVASWTRMRTLTTTGAIYDLAFTPDGQQIISIDSTTLYAHAIATTAPLDTAVLTESTWVVAVSPAASTAPAVAVGTQTGTVRVFTHTSTGFVPAGSALPVTTTGLKTLAVRFSPDGKLLAAAGSDGLVHLWSYPITSTTPTVPDMTVGTTTLSDDMNMVVFSPDGRYLAVAGGFFASLSTWNTAAPRGNVAADTNPTSDAMSLVFSPDGTALIAGEYSCGAVRVCSD